MRSITKLTEPPSLAQHRTTAHADYDNYPEKDTLRAQLVSEQRGLCCFCGGRIISSGRGMKIAHWMPQATHPEHQLDYWNLLASCRGNEGQPLSKQHCDTHQHNETLSRNPADPSDRIEDFIQFHGNGTITSQDPILAAELGSVKADGKFEEGLLNLNLPFLRTNRRMALKAFTKGLAKRRHLAESAWRNLLSSWSGIRPGQLEAYAPVIAYWLRKKLARR